ncbi:adenosylmethionine-8-amino-7-oxononanoate aminotransferase [Achlya hypogyna]|uniref:Adenosylmethionine-8-amino-7-oxononanoate aminotransferase n=1 Tax=Achlya hypogyna TaxID=1202772 RepID=A0A1V9ZB87_ACHHY|nr:adenosylmethionine-8-amino-7-oxononanoate aminotransferase [Achlya hypogyna]
MLHVNRSVILRAAYSTAAYGSVQRTYTLQNGHALHYFTHGPAAASTTYVLFHGAPGSHKDFKYLAPLLGDSNAKVIAFDLPGNGITAATAAGGLERLNADTVNAVAVEAVDGLLAGDKGRTIVLGHSCGGHTAIEVAARAKRVHGLVLLNSMGLRPHQGIRPFGLMNFGARQLSSPGMMRDLVAKANHWLFVEKFKFPRRTPLDDLTFALQRFGTANFTNTKTFAKELGTRKFPSVVAWAVDDALVEKEIPRELSAALNASVRKEYQTGGHNIQKMQAPELANILAEWTRRAWLSSRAGLGQLGCISNSDQTIPNAVATSLRAPIVQVFGSNTDVGKTVIAAGLCRAALRSSPEATVGYIKPLQTGGDAMMDAGFLKRHTGDVEDAASRLSSHTLFSWETAVSPHLAASLEGKAVDDAMVVNKLSQTLRDIQSHHGASALTVVETAGGVCSPSASGKFQCDVYRPLRLPAVLVGDGRLGGISATMSALDSLLLRGYDVTCIVLIEQDNLSNGPAISDRAAELGIPVFALDKLPPQPEPLAKWYQRSTDAFDAIYDSIAATHRERLARLQALPAIAKETLWWPFTQHKSNKGVLVIDSAYGDTFATYNATTNAVEPMYDACASWWTQGVGHGNAKMALALGTAAGRYGHVMFPENAHEPAVVLAEKLLTSVGKGWAGKVFFSDNGSTAVEVGIKMALRKYAVDNGLSMSFEGVKNVLVLAQAGCYHGDTLGAMDVAEPSVYNATQHPWYKPKALFVQPPSVHVAANGQMQISWDDVDPSVVTHLPSMADVFDISRDASSLTQQYTAYIENKLASIPADTVVGALVLEPVLIGAGGMVFVDPLFQRTMVRVCKRHKIPVVFDEVFSGFWRLGAECARDLLHINPDIACYAKLLTGGAVPLSTTLATNEVFDAFYCDAKADALLHGHSFTANPVGCAAAVTALDLYTGLAVPADGATRVQWDEDEVAALAARPGVARAFQLGTVLVIELKSNSRGYTDTTGQDVLVRLRANGIYARSLGNVLYIMASPLSTPETCKEIFNTVRSTLQFPPSIASVMEPIHATLPFPNGQLLHYTLWGAPTAATSFVCLHGAPGTHADFQDLAPLLVADDINVLAFDLPGSGRSSVDIVGGMYYFDATSVAKVVINALQQLSYRQYVIVGHSFGGHTALQVAADASLASRIRGVALMNPTGLRPPRRSVSPRVAYWFGVALRLAGRGPNYFTNLNRDRYVNKFKFSDDIPDDDFTTACLRMASTDFAQVRIHAEEVCRRQVPVLIVLAKDDRIVECDIGQELAVALGTKDVKLYDKGGHNVPKTQAVDVARERHRGMAAKRGLVAPLRRVFSTTSPPYGSVKRTYTLSNGEDLHYTTLGRDDAALTFVLLHGAPGSHKDFKHIAPLLVRDNINVLAFDLPGNGRTSVSAVGGPSALTADAIGNVVVEALDGLSLPRAFLVGHSFGGHTALEAAARARRVDGLALLNAAGLRPHQAIRPFAIMEHGARLLFRPGFIRDCVVRINHWAYINIYKFPRSARVDDLTFGFQRFGTSNWSRIAACAAQAQARGVPVFSSIALDDHLVEKEIGRELRDVLQPSVHKEYAHGGHNIQKTQAADIADALVAWSTSIAGLDKTTS